MMTASAALQAYGQFQQGQAANKAGKYNRDAAYREAEALDIQAGQEVAAASHNSERIAARAREIIAANRAKAAAGGQSAQDGSVVAIEREAVKNASLDQLIEIAEGEERAQQIRHRGAVTRRTGDYERYKGKVAARAGRLQAMTTLTGSAVSWYDKFGGGSAGGLAKAESKSIAVNNAGYGF